MLFRRYLKKSIFLQSIMCGNYLYCAFVIWMQLLRQCKSIKHLISASGIGCFHILQLHLFALQGFIKMKSFFWYMITISILACTDSLADCIKNNMIWQFFIEDSRDVFPTNVYLFIAKRCEICSKLTIKTPERSQWQQFCITFRHFCLISIKYL